MFLISTLNYKIFISADFEPKKFSRFFRFSANFRSKFFDSKSTEWKFYYAKWIWGTNFMKQIFLSYIVKNGAYEANSHVQKRFSDFSQRGYVFGFYWQWTMKLHTLRYSNSPSAILEDFFSIRFKPHQVVPRKIPVLAFFNDFS